MQGNRSGRGLFGRPWADNSQTEWHWEWRGLHWRETWPVNWTADRSEWADGTRSGYSQTEMPAGTGVGTGSEVGHCFPDRGSEPPVRDFDCGGQSLSSGILAVTNFAYFEAFR